MPPEDQRRPEPIPHDPAEAATGQPKAPSRPLRFRSGPAKALILLILFQALCALFFVIDVTSDMENTGLGLFGDWHLIPELGATLGLILGIGFEVRALMALLRRQSQLEQGMSVAAGALATVMDQYFQDWGLTPSEADVAAFTVKGYAIAEIATFRGSAEGTVKTHLNAIYRKAGVTGRGQLVSLLVEDLLRAPLVNQPSAAR